MLEDIVILICVRHEGKISKCTSYEIKRLSLSFFISHSLCLCLALSPPLSVSGCKYTCHPQCRDRVSLDCHQNGPATDGPHSPLSQDHVNNNQDTHAVSALFHVCVCVCVCECLSVCVCVCVCNLDY